MLFGDTRHTASQPYNVLSGAGKDGLFPRTAEMLGNLSEYSSVLHSYCVETDPICAQGDVVKTHLNYFDVYTDEVAAWVHNQIEAAGGDVSASSTATTTRATGTVDETATETLVSTSAADSTTTTPLTTKTSTSKAYNSSKSPATSHSFSSDSSTAETSSVSATSAPMNDADNGAPPWNSQLGGVLFFIGVLLAI